MFVQVEIVQKQCAQAQQAVHQLQEAQAGSSHLQSQLGRLQQSQHSQQQFVTSLEATIAGTNPGDTSHNSNNNNNNNNNDDDYKEMKILDAQGKLCTTKSVVS